MRFRSVLALGSGLVLLAMSSAAGQEHPGAEPYRQVCELCHGAAGRGDIAPALVPFGFDAEYVLAVVREGYGQMPPISRRELDDDAVRQVAGFLEALTASPGATGAAADESGPAGTAEAGASPQGATGAAADGPGPTGAAGGPGPQPGREEAAAARYDGPRTAEGQPDLNGIWQSLNSASWDIRPHNAQDGVPAGLGVVEGGEIPYQPWAAAQQQQNYANRLTEDPVRKCYLPGVPRITYMPFPFRILQTPDHVVITYEYAHAVRIIYTDGSDHPLPNDFWMGDSRGHWEGDTLVVDTTHFNGQTWFDAAGNFHSDQLHVIERYTPITPYHVDYAVTIEDPEVFTRPWTMRMPLYRRVDEGLQLLDYDCVDFILQALTAPEGGAQ
jgi:cytochrome c553